MDSAHGNTQPSPGDVIVTTELGLHFLSVFPNAHRLSFKELSKAIQIGTQWASANGGDVWLAVDGVTRKLEQRDRSRA